MLRVLFEAAVAGMRGHASGAIHQVEPTERSSLLDHPQALPGLLADPATVDESHVVVKHPTRERYFRLSTQMADVLFAMDGTKSIDQLSESTNVSAPRLRGLVEHLAAIGLIYDSRTGAACRSTEGNGVADAGLPAWLRRLIFVRLDVGAPDQAVDWLYRGLRSLVRNRYALVAIVALPVVAALIGRWGLIVAGVSQSSEPRRWWLIIVAWLAVGPIHELGHAVACKHFGREVKSLGVGLYFFVPVLYADVSDTWRLTSRRARALVHSAGLIAEAALLSLASLALIVVPSEALGVVVGSLVISVGISVVVNANPLIKLDGYFVLCDIVGIDNLREKAFGTFFSRLRNVIKRTGVNVRTGAYTDGGRGESLGLVVYAAAMFLYGGLAFAVGIWRNGLLLDNWHLPHFLLYANIVIGLLFLSSFIRYVWARSVVGACRRF